MTMAPTDTAWEIAEVLLRIGAVLLNAREPFTYASGARSPIYCDNRLLISYPAERRFVITKLADAVSALQFEVVAGTATAGIPFAAWLAERLDRPMVYVRDAPKEHGRQQLVEGIIKPGQRAIVVEDLVTTGRSALQTVEGLRGAGAEVTHSTAIFTYESPAAVRAFEGASVNLIALSGIRALLEVATSSGRLSEEDARMVRDWQAGLGR